MATTKELTKIENKFMFRGKRYKFLSYFPTPSIEMIADDGEKFSFGVDSPVSKEFILSQKQFMNREEERRKRSN